MNIRKLMNCWLPYCVFFWHFCSVGVPADANTIVSNIVLLRQSCCHPCCCLLLASLQLLASLLLLSSPSPPIAGVPAVAGVPSVSGVLVLLLTSFLFLAFLFYLISLNTVLYNLYFTTVYYYSYENVMFSAFGLSKYWIST